MLGIFADPINKIRNAAQCCEACRLDGKCDTWSMGYGSVAHGSGCESQVQSLETEFGRAVIGTEEGCVNDQLGPYVCALMTVRTQS